MRALWLVALAALFPLVVFPSLVGDSVLLDKKFGFSYADAVAFVRSYPTPSARLHAAAVTWTADLAFPVVLLALETRALRSSGARTFAGRLVPVLAMAGDLAENAGTATMLLAFPDGADLSGELVRVTSSANMVKWVMHGAFLYYVLVLWLLKLRNRARVQPQQHKD
eukprot:m51a1_g5587 hypothetical protein (167) ;mRNA; f:642463-642963